MNSTTHPRSRALRLIAGWGALLLFVGVSSPVGLGIAALGGSLDRSHRLSVQGCGTGLQLVLHHERSAIAHRHGVVARTLALFAQPASATNPDHVIQFSAPDSFSRLVQFGAPAPEAFAQAELALHEIPLPCPQKDFISLVATHSPPDDAGQLIRLRSIQILI